MDKKFFRSNRKRLFALLPDRCMVVISSGYPINRSADEDYEFVPNNNFYYLTGIRQAGVKLVMLKSDNKYCSRLFIDAYDEDYAKWIGHKLTPSEASEISGVFIKEIFFNDDFEADIEKLKREYKIVFLDLEKHNNTNYNSFGLSMAEKFNDNELSDAYPLIARLRGAKTKPEVEVLNDAIEVTRAGIEELMANSKPGMYEYQLEAHFDFAIKQRGNREHSFKTIAASGVNATTLHYSANDNVIKDGDLILFDLGARSNGYCADISRTFPVNGKFSELQKKIYSIVLKANKLIIRKAKAGMTLAELQKICVASLTKDCLKAKLIKEPAELKNYYFHSVSHSIGLDTHDPMDRNEPLPVGAVISDEPGLYFPQYGIGIRIEDDLLLKKNSAINLSQSIIKEIDEIEAFMSKNR